MADFVELFVPFELANAHFLVASGCVLHNKLFFPDKTALLCPRASFLPRLFGHPCASKALS